MHFLVNLSSGDTLPLPLDWHSKGVTRFNPGSTPGFKACNPGVAGDKSPPTGVICILLLRLRQSRFLLFGKHVEQTIGVGSFHELRVVKERIFIPPGRIGTWLDFIVFCSPMQEKDVEAVCDHPSAEPEPSSACAGFSSSVILLQIGDLVWMIGA